MSITVNVNVSKSVTLDVNNSPELARLARDIVMAASGYRAYISDKGAVEVRVEGNETQERQQLASVLNGLSAAGFRNVPGVWQTARFTRDVRSGCGGDVVVQTFTIG